MSKLVTKARDPRAALHDLDGLRRKYEQIIVLARELNLYEGTELEVQVEKVFRLISNVEAQLRETIDKRQATLKGMKG